MGKSLLLVMLCAACVNNVSSDRRTGPDGKVSGARELTLEQGAGKQRGIITYPGGDRVDWTKVVLPATGKLDLKMTYTTPRPDLKATFDVFDQTYRPIKETASGKGRNKSLSIVQATGTYFIRVYAPRRTDAASYVLEASFVADKPGPGGGGGMDKVPVPDPPRLAPVPEPDPDCMIAYDASNLACTKTCAPGSPKNHKACQLPPDPNAPPPPPPPPPPEVKKPVIARIMTKEMQADGTIIVTLGAGSDHGVGKDWTQGSLLRGDTKDPKAKFPNGGITVLTVNKNTTRVRLRQGITSDILLQNDKVVLEP